MYQPYPPSGQSAGPQQRTAPAPVRTAVRFMYAGATVSAVGLVIGLALIIVDIKAAARGHLLGHSLTEPQMRPLVITAWIVFGLAGGFGATVLYYGGTALVVAAWLAGAAAVWLLWRPASRAFFKSTRALRPLPQISGASDGV